MKKIILVIMLIFSTIVFAEEKKAEDFLLKDQFGVEQSLERYEGKIIFLNFWVSWCPTCRGETDTKKELFKKYGENKEDVIFLGVNNEELANVKSYINQKRYNIPTVLEAQKLFEAYEIKRYPTTFVIDRDGNIVKRLQDKETLNFENVEKIIEEIENK